MFKIDLYIKDVFTLAKIEVFVSQNYLHHYYEPEQLTRQLICLLKYITQKVMHNNSTVRLHTVQQEIYILAVHVTWFCNVWLLPARVSSEKYRYELSMFVKYIGQNVCHHFRDDSVVTIAISLLAICRL